jgi:para-nitrobenzyl esterase
MARKLLIALLILAVLAGGAAYFLRAQQRAASPAPAELARVADPASLRTLRSGGEVVGYAGRYGSHVWLGIPYAEPPVGERRWRAPAPPAAWSGTREALAFGAHCPQIASMFGGASDVPFGSISGSEDCLFLNVYAPRMDAAAAAQARLPVMMWIHGGGNTIGLSDFFDGGRLAQEQNLMVVTLNYRLGPLGWLHHPALREGATPAEQSGNFAILDLMRALEWLRENASGFGGDPGNVTIFGESAGGWNVFTLLLSPLASGLFHRAIVQSGGTDTETLAAAENFADAAEPGSINSSNEVLARLLVREGKASDAASARQALASMPAAEVAGFLRGLTPEQLLAGYQREGEEGMFEMPQGVADGVVLRAGDPLSLLARPDGWNRVPVIAGTTRDEYKLFMFMDPLYVRWWLGLLPRVRKPDLFLAMAEARSAFWKATGADGPAAAIWKTQPKVFVYRFDWDEEPSLLGVDVGRYVGAAHGFEIPFVFGHWDLGGPGNVIYGADDRAGREALSAGMMSYWASFARSGDPGRGARGELPVWSAWDGRPQGHKFMILDTEAGGGLRMGSEPVTVASVLASVEADPRLASQRERCLVYRELARWGGDGFGEQAYQSAGREGCAEYPFDQFPWE